MKRMKLFCLLMAVMVLFASGCSGNYEFSGSSDHHTIKVNASDGAYGESYDFIVSKDRDTVIQADLSSGSLQIEFAHVTIVMTDPDVPEDVIVGQVEKTVTLSGKDQVTISLPEDSYIMQVTANGSTKGTVKIDINKK